MGCWGPTRDCLRNCCGGPRSENYDAWLARERLRQLNFQTQRNDQLNRQNVQLEMTLTQTQDLMASYRDIDIYETGHQDSLHPPMHSQRTQSFLNRPDAHRTTSTDSQRLDRMSHAAAAQQMDRRQTSMNLDLAPTPQTIRRDQLRSQSTGRGRQSPPSLSRPSTAPTYYPAPSAVISADQPQAPGVGKVLISVPALTPRLGPTGIAPVPEDRAMDPMPMAGTQPVPTRHSPTLVTKVAQPSVRQQATADLRASVAQLPAVAPAQVPAPDRARGPFAAPAIQQPAAYASTHGYRPS